MGKPSIQPRIQVVFKPVELLRLLGKTSIHKYKLMQKAEAL